PSRVARWSIPLVAVPVLVFTMGVLSADAAKTNSWTLTAQNLDALGGDTGCGLADHLVAPAPSSMRPLPLLSPSSVEMRLPGWVPPAPVGNLRRFTLAPVTSGSVRTPWFAIRSQRPLGVLAAGAVTAETKLTVEFARLSEGRARVRATETLSGGTFQRGLQDMATWLFLAPVDHSAGPRQANAVRIALRGSGMSGAAVAVTAPVTYTNETLARALERSRSSTLTNPFVLPYFPCAREPRLSGGIVEAPSAIVSFPCTRTDSPTGLGQTLT